MDDDDDDDVAWLGSFILVCSLLLVHRRIIGEIVALRPGSQGHRNLLDLDGLTGGSLFRSSNGGSTARRQCTHSLGLVGPLASLSDFTRSLSLSLSLYLQSTVTVLVYWGFSLSPFLTSSAWQKISPVYGNSDTVAVRLQGITVDAVGRFLGSHAAGGNADEGSMVQKYHNQGMSIRKSR